MADKTLQDMKLIPFLVTLFSQYRAILQSRKSSEHQFPTLITYNKQIYLG